MNVIRPSGMIERLGRTERPAIEFQGYGRAQPGPATPEEMRRAARHDRRRRQRGKAEPLRGRVVDLTA